MKKIKPVIQKDLKDCGVCSILWIINFYNGNVSLEKLREETLTDLNGTNFYQMIKCLNWCGFDAKGLKIKDINFDEIHFPAIVQFKLRNGLEHFVVVRYLKKQTVYLMDPAVGYKELNINEFNELFTGYLLNIYPRENVIFMEKNNSIKKLFLNVVLKEKFIIIKIIIASLLWTIISIIVSYYLKVGSNLMNEDKKLLLFTIGIFFILNIMKIIINYIREYYQNHLNIKVDSYLYPEFIEHIFNIPLTSIKSRTTGEIMTRVDDISNIKSFFSDILISLIVDSFLIGGSIIILLNISYKLFIIIILFIIVYILISILISKVLYQKIVSNINTHTELNSILVESIDAIDSINNLNIVSKILHRIEYKLSNYLYNNYSLLKFYNLANTFKDLILVIGIFLVNSYGLMYLYEGDISIINLFTFNIFLGYIEDSVKNLLNSVPKYYYVKASFSKINDFINIDKVEKDYNTKKLKGDIKLNNVSYSYNNYHNVINNLNLLIKEGEHVIFIGPSGCGKSTICNIIAKNIKRTNGQVYIGNDNLDDIKDNIVHQNICYISQNENIFTGSIRENILLDRKISEQKFRSICKITKVDDIVTKKGLRYDSLIGPNIKNISGGELQRIILARGLVNDFNILILDEALSEVDYYSEKNIIKNIRKFYKNKTIIYVSHKKNIGEFDKIINLGGINELL